MATSIRQYRELKRKLKKYESQNYNKIYLIPCNGNSDWHELAEHSALIYYYEVCKKLNSKTKFFADTLSFYDQYDIGYIRTLGIDHLRDNLKKVKLYQKESNNNGIRIFSLNKTFTADCIRKLWQEEKARRANNLTPTDAYNLDPELHQLLVALSIRLHSLCNNRLDKLSAHTNGVIIVRLADALLANYHRLTMVKQASSPEVAILLDTMRKDVLSLIVQIKVLSDIKMLSLETIASLSENIYLIRDRIELQIKISSKLSRNGSKGADYAAG